jgi:hypothetical protein
MTRIARLRRVLVAGAAVVLLVATGNESASPGNMRRDPGPVRYVSPRGSDANPGTIGRPWRTLAKAMSALRPGQTAYVRAGEYVEADVGQCRQGFNALDWRASGRKDAPITIAGYPDERGRVVIRTQINLRGDYLRLSGLVLERNGAYSSLDRRCSGAENVTIRGDDAQLFRLDIRNSNMSGVYLRDASRANILRCRIHGNGTHERFDHGIYVSSSAQLLIANTLIFDNAAYGLHIYPGETYGARILQNTLVRNAQSGLIISGDSTGNVIANNVLAFNGQYGARDHELDGFGNVLASNLFFANGTAPTLFEEGAIREADSYVGSPEFVDADAGDFRLGPTSSALDRALPALSMPGDFRGVKRPRGAAPDIGAFER